MCGKYDSIVDKITNVRDRVSVKSNKTATEQFLTFLDKSAQFRNRILKTNGIIYCQILMTLYRQMKFET